MIKLKVIKIFGVAKVAKKIPSGCSDSNLDEPEIREEYREKSETEYNESCRKGKSGGELNLGLQNLV